MKVHILTADYGYEGEHVLGVFPARVKAEKQIPAMRKKIAAEDFPIEEYELDAEAKP